MRLPLLIGLFSIVSGSLCAQVSGRVFEDLNANGLFDSFESGKANIVIKAYTVSTELGQAQLFTQTSSDDKGYYELAVPAGQAVRIVFDSRSLRLQSSGTTPTVRFVISPRTNLNYGCFDPYYLQDDKSEIVSPIYHQGIAKDTLSALSALVINKDSIYSLATPAQVGALWGVAYDASKKMLYSAALAKRHVAYGPLGPGGIYRTDWETKKTVPYLDLKSLGIPTGIDRHAQLSSDLWGKSIDPQFMDQVGKVSLGGIDVLDGKLYVMNLSNRTLYSVKLPVDTAVRPTITDLKAFTLPQAKNGTGVMRPFAVKAHQGKIYVGIIWDASLSQIVQNLSASVLELDPENGVFTNILTIPMDYNRGKVIDGLNLTTWLPWSDDFSQALYSDFPSIAVRPQPILSSIAFDSDGALILGFMDRFGHQSGTGQPDPLARSSYTGIAAGDVLRVYPRTPQRRNVHYTLETNAQTGKIKTQGLNNAQGPQGGEFYFGDQFESSQLQPRVIHEETGVGGLLYLPLSKELLMTVHEPAKEYNTGGIKAFSISDGVSNRGWNLYADGQAGTFSKTNGVGGLALARPQMDITLGDRLWLDINENGIQDPDEEGLVGQKVELYHQGSRIAQTFSDKEGRYSFSILNVKGGIQPNSTYAIKFPLPKELKLTKQITNVDSELDNDAVLSENRDHALITLTTKNPGESLHHLDAGFVMQHTLVNRRDISENELIVYPNPVSEYVQIKCPSKALRAELCILNSKGQTILKKNLIPHQGQYHQIIQLSELPVGMYILQLTEEGSFHLPFKLIKE